MKLTTAFLSAANIVREVTGPFNQVYLVEIVVFVQQELNFAFVASLISLQVKS
jgi:hypothetical protein